MKIICESCRREIETSSSAGNVKCPFCGRICRGKSRNGAAQDLVNKMAGAVGLDAIEGFSFSHLFSEVFRKHSEEEVEQHWAAGTFGNIPSIDKVNVSWPTPWVFVRFFLITLIAYAILYFGWRQWHNPFLLPGLMLIGCFAVPASLVILFFEFNVRKNVSLYSVIKTFLIGGTLSLVFSLIMFRVTDQLGLGWLGKSTAGIAEEIGKLIAVIVFIQLARFPYILNGLLFGAVIGAGFAAFESSGYAFIIFLAKYSQSLTGAVSAGASSSNAIDHGAVLMINNVAMRGFLTCLAGHILWTGMSAAALFMVSAGRKFEWDFLFDFRFLRIFLVAVISHMVWNSPWDPQLITSYDKYFLIGIINWIVIFAIVQKGLNQLREEKKLYASAPEKEPAVAEVIREQQKYIAKSTQGAVSTSSRAVRAPATVRTEEKRAEHRFADPVGIRENVERSRQKEEQRKEEKFSKRAWQKYYENNKEE